MVVGTRRAKLSWQRCPRISWQLQPEPNHQVHRPPASCLSRFHLRPFSSTLITHHSCHPSLRIIQITHNHASVGQFPGPPAAQLYDYHDHDDLDDHNRLPDYRNYDDTATITSIRRSHPNHDDASFFPLFFFSFCLFFLLAPSSTECRLSSLGGPSNCRALAVFLFCQRLNTS